ncbi:bacterioferritin-associated ferredoxin [Duganella sp. 1224]|nr:bacterioferritin-associated ferredoxin [Duganella sp. 1224]
MELGITSMDELRDALGVATCCGQCFSCAEEILNEQLAVAAAANIQETVLKRPVFSN